MQENEPFGNEEGALQPLAEEATLWVLQAAVEEARGRAGAYVTRDRVMQRMNMEDSELFKAIAEQLEERGWIDAAGFDHLAFVVTICGHAEAVSRAPDP
jgi:hypothetical protein